MRCPRAVRIATTRTCRRISCRRRTSPPIGSPRNPPPAEWRRTVRLERHGVAMKTGRAADWRPAPFFIRSCDRSVHDLRRAAVEVDPVAGLGLRVTQRQRGAGQELDRLDAGVAEVL